MATAAEMKARLAKYAKPAEPAQRPSTPVVAQPVEEVLPAVRTTVPDQTLAVQTDVQSTDVVILERPNSLDHNLPGGSTSQESNDGGAVVPGVSTNLDVSNPVHQDFLQRLADLEAALLIRDPLMKTHLGAIHKMMIGYEEIANLLTVEEISKIMEAQQQHTGIVLRAETVGKSKAAATKKANQLSINDV